MKSNNSKIKLKIDWKPKNIPTKNAGKVIITRLRQKNIQAVRIDIRASQEPEHGHPAPTVAAALSKKAFDVIDARDDSKDGQGLEP